MLPSAGRTIKDLLPRNPLARSHVIFGANTDVGKTVISAGLVRASLSEEENSAATQVHYIKPLQCGGSDASFVQKHCSKVPSSDHLRCQTLFTWETPASPHVAARKENLPKSDEEVLASLKMALEDISKASFPSTTWIETAGGVLSPSPSSPDNNSPEHASGDDQWGWLTQGDLYQPLAKMAPVVLCGDGKLGGISATLSSLESLIIRGYNVVGIVMLETGYGNVSAIREYAAREVKLTSASGSPLFENPERSIVSLPQLPPEPEPLHDWYASDQVVETLGEFNLEIGRAHV